MSNKKTFEEKMSLIIDGLDYIENNNLSKRKFLIDCNLFNTRDFEKHGFIAIFDNLVCQAKYRRDVGSMENIDNINTWNSVYRSIKKFRLIEKFINK